MNTNQENKLNMYMVVRDFLTANDAVIKDLPGLADNFNLLRETIIAIQAAGENQKYNKTGFSKEKRRLRNELMSVAADFSRKIAAYGRFSGNEIIISEIKYTNSDLMKMTDVALKDYAQIIFNKAQQNIESLAHYGISPELLQSFGTLIASYNEILARPRIGITEKSQATEQLKVHFSTAEIIIENLDLSLGIIKLTNSEVYHGYKSARTIVDTGKRSFSVKAVCTDKLTGEPVSGVKFAFSLNGRDAGAYKITKLTSAKGMFYVRNMPAGTYSVIISKPGFRDKNITVSVASGERSDLKVEIERSDASLS